MAIISIEKEILENLVSFKLKRIQTIIQEILNRWNENSTTTFIEKARNGTYENAENDAIELRQLLLEEKNLNELIKKYTSE
ncbi:hypothetical protein DSAG12_02723 [Promethearchaeum syntrophicum]|uniref:Uncharacterized protein n=1 Tax=Promethearchaeum syntrophicum TaxID=2594042 RepID=A0A5B9DDQ1_9ARCH|nr:hypothetical protein [Candidatus Prometheoarchaeum syntrophicum]QEE16893.1 hypothetical protein DSAG12_02723 [Candidatus Prometheoarchaeum syntrophicum]